MNVVESVDHWQLLPLGYTIEYHRAPGLCTSTILIRDSARRNQKEEPDESWESPPLGPVTIQSCGST